jgi:hypothetical protein
MTLGFFELGVGNDWRNAIWITPKRYATNPLFVLRGCDYAKDFFEQIRGLGNIGIVKIDSGVPKIIATRL